MVNKFKILRHPENQHGWAVSLTINDGRPGFDAFVINSLPTREEQREYTKTLSEKTGFPMVEWWDQ